MQWRLAEVTHILCAHTACLFLNQCPTYSVPVPLTSNANIEVGVGSSVPWLEGMNDSTVQPESPVPSLRLCQFPYSSHHRYPGLWLNPLSFNAAPNTQL